MVTSTRRGKASAQSNSPPIRRFPSAEFEKKFEKFSSHTVFVERQLALVDLSGSQIASWVNNQDWGNLAMIEGLVNFTMIREFYCNITLVNLESEVVQSHLRGREVCITPTLLGGILNLTPLAVSDYPFAPGSRHIHINGKRDAITCALTEKLFHNWGEGCLTQGDLTGPYRLINLFFCASVEPCSHTSSISAQRGFALKSIGEGRPVDWCRIAFRQIARFKPKGFPLIGSLPYGVILSKLFLSILHIPTLPDDVTKYSTKICSPLDSKSLSLSVAHATEHTTVEGAVSEENEEETGAPSSSRGCRPRASPSLPGLDIAAPQIVELLQVIRQDQIRHEEILLDLQASQKLLAEKFEAHMQAMREFFTPPTIP
ncbi:hypothetical protein Vadar_013890 [Vaccinium darrowii]|uniref:Uncharacterized protein n=1 Tax=Vaccinium darrowii TaxID=229202 RepID=A0ACB7YWB4_9ERIC|nr:hypothetical protein Vadar_013890 [Vaccinium darrowii]